MPARCVPTTAWATACASTARATVTAGGRATARVTRVTGATGAPAVSHARPSMRLCTRYGETQATTQRVLCFVQARELQHVAYTRSSLVSAQVCDGHGVCDGSGTTTGTGLCTCYRGYNGSDCGYVIISTFPVQAQMDKGLRHPVGPTVALTCATKCRSSRLWFCAQIMRGGVLSGSGDGCMHSVSEQQ